MPSNIKDLTTLNIFWARRDNIGPCDAHPDEKEEDTMLVMRVHRKYTPGGGTYPHTLVLCTPCRVKLLGDLLQDHFIRLEGRHPDPTVPRTDPAIPKPGDDD